jgi:hypothetical protein
MVLLDAITIARNVGSNLDFVTSSHSACLHSDLGYSTNCTADALPHGRPQDFAAGTLVPLSGLAGVFVRTLA